MAGSTVADGSCVGDAVPEETSKVATWLEFCRGSSAARTPPPVASPGAVIQCDIDGWGVAAGSAADGSTEPMAPWPSTVYPYQTRPPATATEAGALAVPVDQRADSVSVAVSTAATASPSARAT
ncbi:hypothetical protein [Streptomyces sp. NPDC005209]|uniref:hypothetical protein n=1 Tax=Streptomyces sp. NPDC005209 TaxID=3156715 RepID=UPI0033A85B5A